MGRASRRPRLAPGGQVVFRPPRPAHSFDGGLRRPRLEGQPDARAVERREPADRALFRDADRSDQLLPDVESGRAAVWLEGARLEIPGPVRADGLRLPRGFRDRPKTGGANTARLRPRRPNGD